ncbi:hypothetical protein [Streptomyces sp. NPDC088733]|uniref:hypothetical protein n=1 Tax=Streptomyces sp. NPDC088733 TaxID=3365880 RepID=UPI0038181F96
MSDAWRRYGKWFGDAVVAVILVVCEAATMLGAGLVLMLIEFGGAHAEWLGPTSYGLVTASAGIIAAAAWSERMWVTAVTQFLVAGFLIVQLIRFGLE